MTKDHRALDITLAGPARIRAFLTNYVLNPNYQGFDREIVESLVLISATPAAVVFELTIKAAHTNGLNNLHGGCAALIYDICTSTALMVMAREGFWEFNGVSRNLNVTYIRPVPCGTKVRIESEVVHAGQRLATIRGVMKTEDGKIVSTAEHTKVNVANVPPGKSQL
ncbi:HotDog domain-containing protein [Morchella snyderi]|nr:HotDog domain-containing protein [Morchella snyderi]